MDHRSGRVLVSRSTWKFGNHGLLEVLGGGGITEAFEVESRLVGGAVCRAELCRAELCRAESS